jgi:signal transduction histidine kinase
LVPQRVRFRYKLEGFDKDWRDAGVRRQAFYSKLPPRTYTFRVTASNNDGVWSEAGASFAFSIPPSFTQSVLFKALCAVAVFGLLWLLYTIRLRQFTAQVKARLYERLAERTRIARELHDTLLQSFQGLLLHFQRARNLLPERAAEAIQTLDRALDGAEQAIVEGRDAIHDLRSQAAKGLVEEITSLGEELVAKNGNKDAAQFRAVIEGTAQTLNPNVRIEIFRIAREALRNAFSHSQARRVETEVAYSSNLFRLRIRDDGKGMAPDLRNRGERIGHWGLGGMRERAERLGGELEVWSEPGAGTEVDLRVPASIAYQSSPVRNNIWLFWKKKKNEHEDHS